MRFLGGIMILAGCTGLGLWYRDRFVGRIRVLRTLAFVLEVLMSEIRYGKSTLPECCRELAKRLEEPYKRMFQTVYQEYEAGEESSFQTLFCKTMEEGLSQVALKKEDRDTFLKPFREQGFQDGQMQLKSLEQGYGQIVDVIRQLEGENREKCRMAVGLGVMSGLLLMIILA